MHSSSVALEVVVADAVLLLLLLRVEAAVVAGLINIILKKSIELEDMLPLHP